MKEPATMKNILVTGANGQLGSEIKDISKSYSQWEFFFTDANTLDIRDKVAVEDFVKRNAISVVINCAAYTNVDEAESHIELSNAVNYLAVKNIVEVSVENNIKLIHVSTDYVFNGNTYN